MDKESLNLIKTHFKKLENKIDKIEILLKKSLGEEKKIKKELKDIERDERKLEQKESELEQEERKLMKGVEKIEIEERWNSEIQFYCNHKLVEDGQVVLCGRYHTKKTCNFDHCPLKGKVE